MWMKSPNSPECSIVRHFVENFIFLKIIHIHKYFWINFYHSHFICVALLNYIYFNFIKTFFLKNYILILIIFYNINIIFIGLVLNVSGKDNLPNSLDELSKSLPSDVANQINTADLPKQEEAKKLFKEKCRKNSGGDEAFEKASVTIWEPIYNLLIFDYIIITCIFLIKCQCIFTDRHWRFEGMHS